MDWANKRLGLYLMILDWTLWCFHHIRICSSTKVAQKTECYLVEGVVPVTT